MTTKDTEAHSANPATGAVGSLVERGVGRLEPEREDGDAGHLRRQAKRLLAQLAANRPRRALDLMDAQSLLEMVAAPADADKLIAELIRAAWEWGVSCEIDDVCWGEAGDSHNQMWRDRVQETATRLQASLVARHEPPNVRANLRP